MRVGGPPAVAVVPKLREAVSRRVRDLADIEQQRWPARLWVVRHGQSAGNVARDAAHAAGLPRIDLEARDVDVPLSELGQQQSTALGEWFSQQPVDLRPNVV